MAQRSKTTSDRTKSNQSKGIVRPFDLLGAAARESSTRPAAAAKSILEVSEKLSIPVKIFFRRMKTNALPFQ